MGTDQMDTTGRDGSSGLRIVRAARARKRPRFHVCSFCETRRRPDEVHPLQGGGWACNAMAWCARRMLGEEHTYYCARCSVMEFWRLQPGQYDRTLHLTGLCEVCRNEVCTGLRIGFNGPRSIRQRRQWARAAWAAAQPVGFRFDVWALRLLLVSTERDNLAERAELTPGLRLAELYGLAVRRRLR